MPMLIHHGDIVEDEHLAVSMSDDKRAENAARISNCSVFARKRAAVHKHTVVHILSFCTMDKLA